MSLGPKEIKILGDPSSFEKYSTISGVSHVHSLAKLDAESLINFYSNIIFLFQAIFFSLLKL